MFEPEFQLYVLIFSLKLLTENRGMLVVKAKLQKRLTT
jgi:hypothetical protein